MNAFTLFGELKADTNSFQNSLRDAERRLKSTERAITDQERRAMGLGKTTAVTSRSYEALNESLGRARQRLQATSEAFRRGDATSKQMRAALVNVDKATERLNDRLKNSKARLDDMPGRLQRVASELMTVAKYGSFAAAAFGTFAVKTAADFDSLRRGLTAVAGSADEANKQFQRLKEVAKAPGLGFKEAIQGSINLQAAGLSAQTAERALSAFGNALATVGKGKAELDGVITALTQIQSKGKVSAEEINQLAERLPQIRVAMQGAFGTADTEKIAKMGVDAGKFIEKVVEQFEKLPKATGGAQTAFENFRDAVEKASEPIGKAILDAVLPSLEDITAELEKERPDWDAASKRLGQRVGLMMAEGIKEGAPKILDSIKQEFNSGLAANDIIPFASGMGQSFAKVFMESAGMQTPLFANGFLDGLQRINKPVTEFAHNIGERLGQALVKFNQWGADVGSSLGRIALQVQISGVKIGVNLVKGFIDGVQSLASKAWAVVQNVIADKPIAKAMAGLEEHSPSKVFYAIGKDVVQGFVDGINALKASAQSAMASLVDVSGLKSLTKADAAGVQLLSGLTKELASLNVTTKQQEILLELTAGKYSKLNAAVKERIILAAKEIDHQKLMADGLEKYQELVRELVLPEPTEVERVYEALAGPAMQEYLKSMGSQFERFAGFVLKAAASIRDLDKAREGLGSGRAAFDPNAPGIGNEEGQRRSDEAWQNQIAPPPLEPWENFWATMRERLAAFQKSLPSVKEAIGVNLIDSIYRIGDVFANAVNSWDGTVKGFFKSLARGFAQMVQQILAEVVRLMIIKAIMAAIGKMAGGIGGGELSADMSGAGGVMTSFGSGMRSITSGLSSATAGLTSAMSGFGSPSMAGASGGFAAGFGGAMAGMGGGATYNNQSYSSQFVINVTGGTPEQQKQTAFMVRKEIMTAVARDRERNK